jgi:hypothetical protein
MDKCGTCQSTKITYYRQKIKGGRIVVTARCENWHHPIKGKPFYPMYNFQVEKLPLLPDEKPEEETKQEELWQVRNKSIQEQWKTHPLNYKNFPLPIEEA